MSLMSRKSIGKAGPDKRPEIIVTFRKESDGTYTKITKQMSRDWKTSQIKPIREKPLEEGPYILSDESDFDECMSYEDFDETTKYLYFKLAKSDEE